MFLFNKGIVEAKKIFLLTLMLFQTCVTSVEHKRRYFKVILYFCPYNGSQQNLNSTDFHFMHQNTQVLSLLRLLGL